MATLLIDDWVADGRAVSGGRVSLLSPSAFPVLSTVRS